MRPYVVPSENRGWRRLANLVALIAMLAALLPLGIPGVALASSGDIIGPAGSGQFGKSVRFLPNGNFVVTDSLYDDGATADVGAVYLYNGATRALISTLKGSSASDQVGSGGVTVLTTGNYVVRSPAWNASAGAVSWCDGVTGCSGVVSSANSLIGAIPGDNVGNPASGNPGVMGLSNGNYLVSSPEWDNGGATDAGAVTWGSGTSGISGMVSAANSLVGSSTNDQIGSGFPTLLSNGNYVVRSNFWSGNRGAVTWGNGTTGLTGTVSASNSLVGSTAGDQVGNLGVPQLSTGNYVVRSSIWDNGAIESAGAATWADGTTGITGTVSVANSLVGTNAFDRVSSNGVTALSNGNYVVRSNFWSGNRGAVTWGNGTTGLTGTVSASNSLVGSTTGDWLGNIALTPLSNGNYVISSSLWDGAFADVGAVTWADGTTGITGTVTISNSLVGSTFNDQLGNIGVTALSNGNYVVSSSLWDGAFADVGAATWADGTIGMTGTISAANSLVGGSANDQVGSGGVIVLGNGNYVVSSGKWNGNRGGVTWGNGTAGMTGTLSAANSLVGSTAGDQVGAVTALPVNHNYVVGSSGWDNGSFVDAGAATWGNGTTGITGTISAANSLVGDKSFDFVAAGGIFRLSNGNYVVSSHSWDNGSLVNAGAATWGNGTTGITGTISAANSLISATAFSHVSNSGVTELSNGNYVVRSDGWDNGAIANAGAVTWGPGISGFSGTISAANSLIGSTAGDQVGLVLNTLSDGNYVVSIPNWDSGATVDSGAVTLGLASGATVGPISGLNSVRGTAASGGSGLNFSYDAATQRLAVGRPADNIVTIFALDSLWSEMAVLGNGQTIADDDTTPSLLDGSSFGVVNLSQSLTRTFTISNSGGFDLNLTGTPRVVISGAGAAAFSLVAAPGTPVAPAATTTFQVRFSPTLAALYSATISIANDDADENPYTFDIQGQGIDGPILVNTTADELNGDGDCSLREAIQAANTDMPVDQCGAGSGRDTISVPAGSYLLTLAGIEEDGNATGDLDITAPLELLGAGSGSTIIDGNLIDRVFHVTSTSTDSAISGVTIRRGRNSSPSFTLNNAAGGLFNQGRLTLSNSTVSENTSINGSGGGIYNDSVLTVTNSLIISNSALLAGGGIASNGNSNLILLSSTVMNNSASDTGGGGISVTSLGSKATLTNVTISGNQSRANGGGMFFSSISTVLLSHVTITNNSADVDNGGAYPGEGGGIYVFSTLTPLTIRSSIIAGNSDVSTPANYQDCFKSGSASITSGGYNLLGKADGCGWVSATGDQLGSIASPIDPQLGALADNGGATWTHALLTGSPALNAIPSGTNGCGTTYTSDQRGMARPQGGACDIGAYELSTISISDVNVIEGDGGTVSAVFNVVLTAAQSNTVTVDYATADSTASAPADYTAISGTLTFAPGETSKPITVTVNGETMFEPSETFLVNLGNPSNATILDGQGVGTITNDDSQPKISIVGVTQAEGNSGTTPFNFVVSLSNPSASVISMQYSTFENTANMFDFQGQSGQTLTFASGEISKTIAIQVNGDGTYEPNQQFVVALSSPVNATFLNDFALGTINNDDTISLSINNSSQTEATDSCCVNFMFFDVNVTGSTEFPISYNFNVTNGTAIQGVDFYSPFAPMGPNINPGQSFSSIQVPIAGDLIDEPTETFTITLSSSEATIIPGGGVGTIFDEDGTPVISVVANSSVAEGNSGSTSLPVVITLSHPSAFTITVGFRTVVGGSATAGVDYTAIDTTVTFAPNQTSRTVNIPVSGDTIYENDGVAETVFYEIHSPNANATLEGTPTGTGEIGNDDAVPALRVGNSTVTEGHSGTVDATFVVTLTNARDEAITVDYATVNGTATAGADYTAIPTATLSFNPGETSKTITVTVQGDSLDEANETYWVNLGSPSNATIADGQGLGTITDDDATPTLSINDRTVTEGDIGTQNVTFTVSLSAVSGQVVTVDYATVNGTAMAPDDYTAIPTATLTFNPSETSKTIVVTVKGDTTYENDEDFAVNLGNPSNVTIDDGVGTGTIVNDDAQPEVNIGDATVTEGNSGTVTASFAVTLTNPSAQTVSVQYATANGDAVAPTDYTAVTSTTLSFAPGQTSQTITVTVNGDTTFEPSETYQVNLSLPVNATIADGQGLGTITNDDSQPAISVDDQSVTEGDSGTQTVTFTISLSNSSYQTVMVDYATANGTAMAPGDYTAVTSATLSFAPGETSKTIMVDVQGDLLDENDETFWVNLGNPSNAAIADGSGKGTILDNDPMPTINIGNSTRSEALISASFPVTLSAVSALTVTVSYATSNGTAMAGSDYTAKSGMLTFAPGEISKSIVISLTNDTVDEEDNETFFVTLSAPSNGTLGMNPGLGTITDNDSPPTATINPSSLAHDEGNSGTTAYTFTVDLNVASARALTVTYATADGTAMAGSDYTAASGTLSFAPGETSKTVVVYSTGDLLYEDDEIFNLTLTGGTNVILDGGVGSASIDNDEAVPSLTIDDTSVIEGDSGIALLTFTLTLDRQSAFSITLDYATQALDATAGADYTAASGSITFDPGQTSKTITVDVLGDLLDENHEQLNMVLSNPAGDVSVVDGTGLGKIVDDDGAPQLSVAGGSVVEGNSGDVTLPFTVTLDAPTGLTVTVNYATANGTAMAPVDYTAQSGTLTFAPGETSKPVSVVVHGDSTYENDGADETLSVELSSPSNASLDVDAASGAIVNDDAVPAISIGDVTVTEGDSGTVAATFSVTLTNPRDEAITVDYATANGSAMAGADYTAKSGMLTFAAGETSKTVTVDVLADLLDELDETFLVELSNETNATLADDEATGTITDNDATPSLSIGDVTVTEGDSGTVSATFAVTLSAASGLQVTVDYATLAGTATAGADYTSASGELTFAPGETSQTITVDVLPDLLDENSETFTVTLSGEDNATLADDEATGTITDNDPTPGLRIGDVTVTEGDSGTVAATFVVTLSAASGLTVTVNYGTAAGTATAGADYTAKSGTVTFAPGETSQSVTVDVLPDLLDEFTETFTVELSGATNATIVDGSGTGTITIEDNDAEPELSVIDYINIPEGDSGLTSTTYTVTLSAPSAKTVTVKYATSPSDATPGSDYISASGTLTFTPGVTTTTFTVQVVGDTLDEYLYQFFNIDYSDPTNASFSESASTELSQAVIVDDDVSPSLSIGDVTVTEGDSGSVTASFSVTLAALSENTISVDYATLDGSATAGADYTAVSTTTLSFDPGQTSKTITVAVLGDLLDEQDETFTVELSGATNGNPPSADDVSIADDSGLGTITDNDATPSLSIADVTVTEGDGSPVSATFSVTLSAASGLEVTVDYATTAGTATAGADYTTTSGVLTFAPGETVKTVTVAVLGDLLDENDEAFTVTLSDETNATLADEQATGSITDNDAPPSLSIGDVTVTEGDSGTVGATFSVTLSGASGLQVTVDYATAAGTATAGSDFTVIATSTLTFAPGETSKTVTVDVLADLIDELSEDFSVGLAGATNASIADGTGTGTILDNDPTPGLRISDVTVTEGDSGTVGATFVVTLTNPSAASITVNYTTIAGSATAGSDYTTTSGTLTFAPGETSKTITVDVLADLRDENTETFTVQLSGATNATIVDGSGTGTITILDNDPTPSLSISDALVVTEGNSGSRTATFTVTLSAASGLSVIVNYATANGTATAGSDYTTTSGTLSFAPGETLKTVTVAVLGDFVDENDEGFSVALSGASNATIADNSGAGSIADDDTVGVEVTPLTLSLVEGEAPGTYTVRLQSQPVGTVTITLSHGANVTTDKTTLTFTAANWSVAQVVTVTAVDNVRDEPARADELDHVVSGGDALYSALVPSSVAVSIADDDFGVLMPMIMQSSWVAADTRR